MPPFAPYAGAPAARQAKPGRPQVAPMTEEEKKRKRMQQLAGGGQQAPWSTPGSTANTTGGPSRNPFSSSVYSRPAQTMQGPTVATFSARPQQPQEDLPMWRSLPRTGGSTPGAPGGGSGGMFAPAQGPGGGGGGGGVGGPFQQFMQTIALGPPPPAPGPAPGIPRPGGISLGGGPSGGGPGGGLGPLQVPQNAGGIVNAITGALGGGGFRPQGPPPAPPQGPRPPMSGGGSRPYEAPEPGDRNWMPNMPQLPQQALPQLPPTPPVASLLPQPRPPQTYTGGPMAGQPVQPPPAFTPVAPVSGTGTQFNGNAYQPQAGASGDRTPPGTQYRWGPNGYGYYPI